jgi:hypothetical protein
MMRTVLLLFLASSFAILAVSASTPGEPILTLFTFFPTISSSSLCGKTWPVTMKIQDPIYLVNGTTVCPLMFQDVDWQPWHRTDTTTRDVDVIYICAPNSTPGIARASKYGSNDLKLIIVGPKLLTDSPAATSIGVSMKLMDIMNPASAQTVPWMGYLDYITYADEEGKKMPHITGVHCEYVDGVNDGPDSPPAAE